MTGGQIGAFEDVDADEAFTLPLVHNIAVLVEGAEVCHVVHLLQFSLSWQNDIFRTQRILNTEKDNMITLEHEKNVVENRLKEQEYHLTRLEEVIAMIDRSAIVPCQDKR